MSDFQGACPHCGNTTIAFYFGPQSRSLVIEWDENGNPSWVAVWTDPDHIEESELDEGELQASQEAMEDKTDGHVLNCGSCGHWFNPEETVEADQ